MIVHGRKAFHFNLDLDSRDRDALAHELVDVLNHKDFAGDCPKLHQLLTVIETVEHGATGGLGVTSGPEDNKETNDTRPR